MSALLGTRIRQRLREIDEAGLRRRMKAPGGIDFSSNDYLSLANHPLLRQRMAAAIEHEGVGSTGSRLLRGDRDSFAAIEGRFARFKGTEASLYFATGYSANIGVLATLPEEGDLLFSDALNHASIIDGMRLARARRVIYPHNDVEALRRLLEDAPPDAMKIVVTESLFSMDGDEAPLRELAQLCRETGSALIVDEAHAVGIYGKRGSGLIEEQGIEDQVFVAVNTCGKALGTSGAFVTGSAETIDYLVQRARSFIFSTAPTPAIASAIDAALDIIEGEPERRARLLERSARLRNLLAAQGLAVSPGRSQILSLIIGENRAAVEIATAMQEQGFDVRAIRPPTVPPGTARLRISVNLGVEDGDLERLAEALAVWVPRPSP